MELLLLDFLPAFDIIRTFTLVPLWLLEGREEEEALAVAALGLRSTEFLGYGARAGGLLFRGDRLEKVWVCFRDRKSVV